MPASRACATGATSDSVIRPKKAISERAMAKPLGAWIRAEAERTASADTGEARKRPTLLSIQYAFGFRQGETAEAAAGLPNGGIVRVVAAIGPPRGLDRHEENPLNGLMENSLQGPVGRIGVRPDRPGRRPYP